MSSQLPPIDPNIRGHLARRSAGRLPDGLLAEVSAALDEARDTRPGAQWPRPAWSIPRLAGAGATVALVAVLVLAVAIPALHTAPATSPASYPDGRALSTIELASLMAGPALPMNTTVVASATIDARTDVCPMDRYPTLGVVEGMASQVCVMGATVPVGLGAPKTTGVFAFRYLGPGYLGLLGEITPASTGLAFKVADEWPLAGKTFLVEGWLGVVELTESCASAPTAGDVLDPNGEDCPYADWLADEPVDASVAAQTGLGSSETAGSGSPLLPVPERHVEAGGVHQIDSVPRSVGGTYGVYVVRSVTEQCPYASPQENRGCGAWRVLARVADISIPELRASPALTPTPTTAPPATPVAAPTQARPIAPTGLIGPGNRPLTAAEVSALVAADPGHLVGRYVIDKRPWCQTTCGDFEVEVADMVTPGWTVGQGEQGELLNSGPDGMVWTVPQVLAAWPNRPGIYLVDAWISGASMDSCDVAGSPCYEVSWLGSTPGVQQLGLQLGAYHEFGAGQVGGGASIHGLFLVEIFPEIQACGTGPASSGGACAAAGKMAARLEPAVLP